MSKLYHHPILAIDGGGTRCRVAACFDGKITSVITGSANVSTDFNAAVKQLTEGLIELADQMRQTVESLSEFPAFVGLAGVTDPSVASRLRGALPFRHVRIADDRLAALRGALGRKQGVIAHCGTGSFYAAQIDGDIRFAGGWGPILGDEASAQWVGRRALTLTLESVDGFRESTLLTEQLCSKFETAAGIVEFAGSAGPSEFGALAPHVTDFAARGDSAAQEILRSGGNKIARALDCIGWRSGQPICLTGGIGPHYLSYLPDHMQADVSVPEGEPLDGALSLASEFAKEIANERR